MLLWTNHRPWKFPAYSTATVIENCVLFMAFVGHKHTVLRLEGPRPARSVFGTRVFATVQHRWAIRCRNAAVGTAQASFCVLVCAREPVFTERQVMKHYCTKLLKGRNSLSEMTRAVQCQIRRCGMSNGQRRNPDGQLRCSFRKTGGCGSRVLSLLDLVDRSP